MRVCTVVGTRPEIIKLSRVMVALDRAFEHTIIHTGQNYDYELNEIFFKEMGLRPPNVVLNIKSAGPSEFIGNAMMLLTYPLQQANPDAVLILGDTNSCVAAAYVAKRLKIPVFHLEAGNRCFDERVPEEINRRILDHISDVNLPYSDLARENLMREGIPADRVIKTGSPMNEVLEHYEVNINSSDILERLSLERGEYFVVSVHREENLELFGFPYSVVDLLAHKYNQRVIVSTHPRTAKLVTPGVVSPLVEFHKPFGFFDYLRLQLHAHCTLSDSGTITEESSLLGFPALNLRETHERPEGMEETSVIMTGMNVTRIMESVETSQTIMSTPDDYCSSRVSDKVVRIILSYTDVVNREVWRKRV